MSRHLQCSFQTFLSHVSFQPPSAICFQPPYSIFASSPCPPSLFQTPLHHLCCESPPTIFFPHPLLPSLVQTSVCHVCFQPPWSSLFRAPVRHLGRQSWRSRPSAPDRRSHVAQKTRPWSHRRGAAQSGEAFPAALDMMIVARSCCFESPGSGLRCCCLVSRSAASGTGAGPPG